MDASVNLQFAGTARSWCSHMYLEPQVSTAVTDNGAEWAEIEILASGCQNMDDVSVRRALKSKGL
jgi:hypothetical protein